jgi:hypothetical protein
VACVDRCGSPLHAAIVDGEVTGASLARLPEWSPEIVLDEPLARLAAERLALVHGVRQVFLDDACQA